MPTRHHALLPPKGHPLALQTFVILGCLDQFDPFLSSPMGHNGLGDGTVDCVELGCGADSGIAVYVSSDFVLLIQHIVGKVSRPLHQYQRLKLCNSCFQSTAFAAPGRRHPDYTYSSPH
jgi:hypothetical protein